MSEHKKLVERAAGVKLFLCDVDGILTDAAVWMGGEDEWKRFNVQDGLGLRFLQKEGIKVGWVSNRPSYATTQRALDLKVDYVVQAYDGDKVAAVGKILEETGMSWEAVCFMGDDIVDLGVLRRAGLAATVPHALPEAKDFAHYVTERAAGDGAVREVAELILKTQGKWEKLVEFFAR